MIIVEDLSRIYHTKSQNTSVVALDQVNVQIIDKSFTVITGRSGSGKSTLLHLLGGVDRPSGGQVLIDGVDIFKLSDNALTKFRNQNIGFVFQSFLLEPSLTAVENVALPLIPRKISRQRRLGLAGEMLERVGLSNRIHHKPYQLSGGEKQRISIARALVTSPGILLADEPTGNLDETTGREVLDLMKRLTSECIFILVTHDSSEAAVAPNRIIMRDGKATFAAKGGNLFG